MNEKQWPPYKKPKPEPHKHTTGPNPVPTQSASKWQLFKQLCQHGQVTVNQQNKMQKVVQLFAKWFPTQQLNQQSNQLILSDNLRPPPGQSQVRFWGKKSNVDTTKASIQAALSQGLEFWLCTKQQPDGDQKQLKRVLECREGLPHYIVLAKAKVSQTDQREEFYIHIVFKDGLFEQFDMQNTPVWPPAQEKTNIDEPTDQTPYDYMHPRQLHNSGRGHHPPNRGRGHHPPNRGRDHHPPNRGKDHHPPNRGRGHHPLSRGRGYHGQNFNPQNQTPQGQNFDGQGQQYQQFNGQNFPNSQQQQQTQPYPNQRLVQDLAKALMHYYVAPR